MMRNIIKIGLTLVAFVGLLGSTAHADTFSVQGTTTGSFWNNGGTTNYGNSVEELRFNNGAFGPVAGGTVTLGSFSLGYAGFLGSDNYNPYTFRLTTSFTAPAGAGSTTATADVSGNVNWLFGGSATINFSQSPITVAYSNGSGSGSFTLVVSDVTINAGQSNKALTGTISNATFAATPEPMSIVLLGTVFGGVALVMRKRVA